MSEEQWKSIVNGLEISSLGMIKAFDNVHGWRGPYKPMAQSSNGYVTFRHNYKRYYLAREVATAFLGPPADDETVDHINGVRDDNRICNLRWATRSEQRLNQHGRINRNARAPDAKQEDLPGEKWRIVGRYQVSNRARARVMFSRGSVWGPVFTPLPSKRNTYAEIGRGNAFHRIVALAFLGQPPDSTYTVDHIDGDPTNNLLSNLRWATKAEQSTNRKRKRPLSKQLCKAVEVLDPQTKGWVVYESFSAAARQLHAQLDKKFCAAGVGLTAKRQGTYHGVRMRLTG